MSFVLTFWFFASFLRVMVGYQAVGIVFLMAVLVSGLFLSRVSVFFIALLLSLIHNYFFIPPLHTFTIREPQDALTYFMFFIAAASIGHLTTRLKQQNRIIEEREDRAVLLYELAHAISEANSVDEVVRAGVRSLQTTFDAEVAVVLFNHEGVAHIAPGSSFFPEEKDLLVAKWVRENAKMAGRFTSNFSEQETLYLPLQSRKVIIGAVGLRIPHALMDHRRLDLVQGLVGQVASGLERENLHESRKKLEVLEQADRLFRALFDSVSHELKTPLTTIKGATSALMASSPQVSREFVEEMANQIGAETERLLTVVDNMLDMTRLESGSLKPRVETYDIADILGPSLKRVEPLKNHRVIHTQIDFNVKPLRCDAPLVVQALANILHNSVTHTTDQGRIEIRVSNGASETVEIQICDDGPGLPKDNPNIVFDKFYRVRPESSNGVGLGLSIARGFIEAQGGQLTAANRESGGAAFTIQIPARGREG